MGWVNRRVACLILLCVSILVMQRLQGQTGQKRDQIAQAVEQARAFLRAGKPELAIVEYKKILALNANDADAQANLGVAYYMEHSFREAAPYLSAALKRQPNLWNLAALLGMCDRQMGRNAEAQTHLETAFAHVQEKDLHTAVGKQLFVLYIQDGKLIQAADIIGQLQQTNPSDVDVLYAAHQIYSQLGDATLYSIAQIDPDSSRMYQAKGDQLARQGNMQGAIAAYRQALQRDPHLSGAHYELAEIMSASNSASQREEAEKEYSAALTDNSLEEKALCGLAALELQRSDFDAASQHFAEAIRLEPKDAAANDGMGVVLISLGRLKEAKPYLVYAVELEPKNASVRYRLSQLDRRLGDLAAAKRDMDEFIRLREDQERIDRALKDMRGQLLVQMQRDRYDEASEGAVPK